MGRSARQDVVSSPREPSVWGTREDVPLGALQRACVSPCPVAHRTTREMTAPDARGRARWQCTPHLADSPPRCTLPPPPSPQAPKLGGDSEEGNSTLARTKPCRALESLEDLPWEPLCGSGAVSDRARSIPRPWRGQSTVTSPAAWRGVRRRGTGGSGSVQTTGPRARRHRVGTVPRDLPDPESSAPTCPRLLADRQSHPSASQTPSSLSTVKCIAFGVERL